MGVNRYKPSQPMRMMLHLAGMIDTGRMEVTLPDGSQRRFIGNRPGPQAVLFIHNDRLARRFLTGGALGFCEAYLDGDWSSPDIYTLFEFFLRNEQSLGDYLRGQWWYRSLSAIGHWLKPNTKQGARKNIAAHYDLGNAFYEQWLDRSMTYSSAIFEAPQEDMETAQRRKYASLAERMGVEPGHHVLEIGCGWGGFAEFAARDLGARVTAITISREQHDYAQARIHKAGLSERVEIRLQDYRDVTERFDRIASIEMFEAVGERYWPTFFGTVRDRLHDGGRAALQIITINDKYFDHYRRKADYIQKYIFPGGMLPSITALQREVDQAGLSWQGVSGFGEHYSRTLQDWNTRFQHAWPKIAQMGFDQRFKRMWEQYLHYCAAGFAVGTIDVVHLQLARR
jgi:cyclopropane-fatty-acyl-phospholipid synthase